MRSSVILFLKHIFIISVILFLKHIFIISVILFLKHIFIIMTSCLFSTDEYDDKITKIQTNTPLPVRWVLDQFKQSIEGPQFGFTFYNKAFYTSQLLWYVQRLLTEGRYILGAGGVTVVCIYVNPDPMKCATYCALLLPHRRVVVIKLNRLDWRRSSPVIKRPRHS